MPSGRRSLLYGGGKWPRLSGGDQREDQSARVKSRRKNQSGAVVLPEGREPLRPKQSGSNRRGNKSARIRLRRRSQSFALLQVGHWDHGSRKPPRLHLLVHLSLVRSPPLGWGKTMSRIERRQNP